MYSNDYMYAIERSPDYLAHYGIRGMKWGVRKAIASGNSAKLSRQYAKASKKLAKLEKRAANTGKYKRRAALMGTGAAIAGGAAALGTKGVVDIMGHATRGTRAVGNAMMNASRGIHGTRVGKAMNRAGLAMVQTSRAGGGMHDAMAKGARNITQWGSSNSIAKGAATKFANLENARAFQKFGKNKTMLAGAKENIAARQAAVKGVSNNTIARIGAGAIGAGLAVGAARNAYRAATAQKKAARFKSEMNKAFAGTKYANGGARQGKKRRR